MADRGTGVVIHFDSHWERECAIVVVHRPLTRQVDVLVAGLTTSLVPKFTASVREAVHLAGSPLLVPALVMSELAQNQTDWLALVHPDLEEIQRRLGMANWKYASDSPFYGPHAKDNLLGLDLPAIVTKLQRMADSIRFQDQIALTLIEMLEEMEGKLAGMPGVLVGGGEEEAHGDELEREKAERSGVNEEIEQTMTVLVKSLRGCQRRTMYRSGTIQGLIDTVTSFLLMPRLSCCFVDLAHAIAGIHAPRSTRQLPQPRRGIPLSPRQHRHADHRSRDDVLPAGHVHSGKPGSYLFTYPLPPNHSCPVSCTLVSTVN